MKELKYQIRKQVKDYIVKRYNETYNSIEEYKPSEWELKSNHELETTIQDFEGFKKESVKELKGLFNNLTIIDNGVEVDFHDDPYINELINDEQWRLIYHEMEDKVGELNVDEYSLDLDDIVDVLNDLISIERTSLHLMEILSSRYGYEEVITYQKK